MGVFTIDPASGRVGFPELSLEVYPRMPEAEFLAASTRFNRDNLGFKGGWQRYSVHAPISNDRKLGIFVVFFNERLTKASFAYANKDDSWDNWSEAGELARQKEYRQELASQLGGRDAFPWGRAMVVVDSKGGGTDIWIDYSGAAPSG